MMSRSVRFSIYKTLGAIVLLAVGAAAQAVVVRGGNTVYLREEQYDPGAYIDADYLLSVSQTAGPDFDGTSVWIKKTDSFWSFQSTLSAVSYNLDESVDLYLMRAGDVLSDEVLAQGMAAPLLKYGQRGSIDVSYPGTFYLGIVTGVGWKDTFGFNRNVYGWAKLQNSYFGLTLVDSAMAYGEGGIVVGSLTALAVPEATTWQMLALGLLGVMFVSRKRLSAGKPQTHTPFLVH